MKLSEPWQGKFDALCGLYAAAHILTAHAIYAQKVKKPYDDVAKKMFRRLLQNVEEKELLTAKRISLGSGSGFKASELKDIFNHLPVSQSYGLRAATFSEAWFKDLKTSQKRKLVRSEHDIYAIVQEHGEDHWIALMEPRARGGYKCFDPSLQRKTTLREKIRWKHGILITTPDLIGV